MAAASHAPPATRILLVCTANRCRSPMGAGILRRRLEDHGVVANIETAGLLESGVPVDESAVRLLKARGVDISDHQSHQLAPDAVASATLVIGMEPRHVQEAVLLAPEAWPRSFVLTELVRRGEAIGPRSEEPLPAWIARIHLGRSREDLLRGNDEGITDPHGRSDDAYRGTIEELDALLERFVDLAWGHRSR